VLAAFGATARDETDLERLNAELLRVVDQTMQPEFVGLWMRDPQGGAQQKLLGQMQGCRVSYLKPPHGYWTCAI
jgi:hypothetical protein